MCDTYQGVTHSIRDDGLLGEEAERIVGEELLKRTAGREFLQ